MPQLILKACFKTEPLREIGYREKFPFELRTKIVYVSFIRDVMCCKRGKVICQYYNEDR